MGTKQRFVHEMRRRSEQLEGVYEQKLSDGERTNLRFNNRGGRIAFSKRLPTSLLRRHGCAIIEKLVATLQSYLETDLSSFARIVSFESVWGHRVSTAARPLLKTLVAAVHVATREGRGQVRLGEVTARRLLETMPRYWHAALMAYCDQCAADQPVRCARCDSVVTPANSPLGYDCTCSQDVPLDVRTLCCWDAHGLDPADCSVEIWPSLRAVELVADASREIAARGFTPTEDAFVVRDDLLIMTKIDVNEVLIEPIGIPELRHAAELPADDFRGVSAFAVKLVEKWELFRWGGELVDGEWGASDVSVVGSDVVAEADGDRVLVTLHDVSDQAAESFVLHLVLEPHPVPQLDAGHGMQRLGRLHGFPPGPQRLGQQVEVLIELPGVDPCHQVRHGARSPDRGAVGAGHWRR